MTSHYRVTDGEVQSRTRILLRHLKRINTHTHSAKASVYIQTEMYREYRKKVPDPNMNRHGAELYFAKCRIKMAFLGFFLDIPQVNGENGNCFVSKMDLSQQQRH